MSTNVDDLIGKTIRAAWLCDGSVYLDTTDGVLQLEPEGDCCAHAFICHVSLADALAGATVTSVEDIETTSEERGYEVVDTWGHRIHTTRGTCTFDMRTEHNGYYCGWLNVTRSDAVPPLAVPLADF